MRSPKIVIDSDIILDHLTTSDSVSILRRLMAQYFCYTTVFNAVELFAGAHGLRERNAVENAMSAMKVLGISPKNAKNIAVVYRNNASVSGLIAGIAVESGLPIVTMHPSRFRKVKALSVIPVKKLIH